MNSSNSSSIENPNSQVINNNETHKLSQNSIGVMRNEKNISNNNNLATSTVATNGNSHNAEPHQSSAKIAASSNKIDEEKKKAFKDQVSSLVVKVLSKYMTAQRIATKEDFKHLARKLTHNLVENEASRNSSRQFQINEDKSAKIREYVDKFFSKFEGVYNHSKNNNDQE